MMVDFVGNGISRSRLTGLVWNLQIIIVKNQANFLFINDICLVYHSIVNTHYIDKIG